MAGIHGGFSSINLRSLHDISWFHETINRGEVLVLLSQHGVGSYLVRHSEHYPGDFTLSVVPPTPVGKDNVQHYRIKIIEGKGLTVDDEEYFKSLEDLIQHYKEDADGLCTQLLKPVLKRNAPLSNIENSIPKARSTHLEKLEWQMDRSQLEIGELIGKGYFSMVHVAVYKGKEVAVKIVNDKSTANDFLAEAEMMTNLRHPNLVELLGVVHDSDSIYIVTEYMSKGSLINYVISRGRLAITHRDLCQFARDACCGMAYLEQRNCVHRDLAARNILLNAQDVAKVSDFGLAYSPENESEKVEAGKLPIRWSAPEASIDRKFSNKSDVWSFGILLWEIFSYGRVPYPRIQNSNVMDFLKRGNRMDPPEGCPAAVNEIMQSTWNWDPNKRPSFQELLLKLCQLAENELKS